MNQLSGELNIYNIENVRDEEEAKSANLAERAKINQLGFHWSYNSRREVNHRNEEEVLEGLHPHQNLKSLTIDGFGGKKFPSWMLTSDAMIASSPLVNLIEINLSNCGGVDSYNSTASFPTLRRLTFRDMPKLVEWKDALEVTSRSGMFPYLEELTIEQCPQLRSAPCHFPSLQKLILPNSRHWK